MDYTAVILPRIPRAGSLADGGVALVDFTSLLFVVHLFIRNSTKFLCWSRSRIVWRSRLTTKSTNKKRGKDSTCTILQLFFCYCRVFVELEIPAKSVS